MDILLKDSWTLGEILDALDQVDEGAIVASPKELEVLDKELASKVDACRYMADAWRDEEKRLRSYAAEFEESARAISKKVERLESRILFNMKKHGWSSLTGEKFEIAITTSKKTNISTAANAKTYLKYPDFVKRTYTWDKVAIKNAVKSKPEALDGLSYEVVETFHTRFKVRKDK